MPNLIRDDDFVSKSPLPVVTLIILVLALQFILLPRYVYQISPSQERLSHFHLEALDARLQKCLEDNRPPIVYPVTTGGSRRNPRWNPKSGHNETIILQNATLFDGEKFLDGAVDIVVKKGVVTSITQTGQSPSIAKDAKVVNLDGSYVTPGLVDMHSHHLSIAWPQLRATRDSNEVHPTTGPLTPQLRIVDSIKAYDVATTIIASGGVTTSLILPGSANIMGGEGMLVKNLLRPGANSEEVVEEILLEHGIPKIDRRRYLKMACGENPRHTYHHTRGGNAWLFRQHMERAKELKAKSDARCLEAAVLKDDGDYVAISEFLERTAKEESATELLEYDSTIAMLRDKIGINIHCYESEDFEDMISHSKEFGFRIQAFHHALDAWEVPELIKSSKENITIATFSEFGFFKKEAYEANLWAGKILAEHGVPVAYKSDHVNAETSAKYLLFQAATAHSFHLSEDLALQAVTSVPARSLGIEHRVGYARPGFDADLVVWDSHPLFVGATALQVYIDGRPTLDEAIVADSLSEVILEDTRNIETSFVRKTITADAKQKLCSAVERKEAIITITGITKSYLVDEKSTPSISGNFTMVINNGHITCFDSDHLCASQSVDSTVINLENGHVLPGLTAVSSSLGLVEIALEPSTADGEVSSSASSLGLKNIVYAKYGIHLEGRGFSRARIGGVTRTVTAPLAKGFAGGVSVGIKTSGKKSILNGGIFQDEVALHFAVGQASKGTESISTISSAISKVREIVTENEGKDNIYGRLANGTLPVVVYVENEYDILQLIKVKQDYKDLNLVLYGGSGAPLVAEELAASKIPLILTSSRGGPDTFEKRNALPGPPLSKSPVAILSAAGVKLGLAIEGISDSHIHNLPLEASWAAKYAGLSDQKAINLVSRNIEEILDLEKSKDFVVFEGDPLRFGASVVLGFEGGEEGIEISMCWPESN